MNREDKIRFVDELLASYRTSIVDAISVMPEEWDGFELRQYIADIAAANVMRNQPKRLRDYRNVLATTTL